MTGASAPSHSRHSTTPLGAIHFPAFHSFTNLLPLVVGSAPFGERQLDLGPAPPKVDAKRHQREPLFRYATIEPLDLVAVEQEAAAALPPAGGSGEATTCSMP